MIPFHRLDRNPFSLNFLGALPERSPRSERRRTSWGLRRTALASVIAVGLFAVAAGPLLAGTAERNPASSSLRSGDEALLRDVQLRAVRFFIEQSDPVTGLTRDRAPADGSRSTAVSSSAATGFALSAYCIADAQGWLGHGQARDYVKKTLRFVAEHHAHEHGWLYHFVDAKTGARAWKSEASTIDTALFLQGALFAREYLNDPETTALVDRIYRRIDWQWALNGGSTLSHGWKPETGFIPHRWDSYSELMGMYLLGIGAPSNPLPAESWHAWSRASVAQHDGRAFIQCGPLFTHQYSHGWFDFRGRRDAYADYWQNSVDATLAQRAWSAHQGDRFRYWSNDVWGLTASDGPKGYMAWGTPGRDPDQSDGTLVPCAPGGSLPFAPQECLTALRRMREIGGNRIWGRYGFADAFNPQTGWTSPDVIAIDVGITLVMAENLRTGLVWHHFMQSSEARRGMKLAGFSPAPARETSGKTVATTRSAAAVADDRKG